MDRVPYVVANYEVGLRRGERVVGRVRKQTPVLRLNGLRVLNLEVGAKNSSLKWQEIGLWTGRQRTIRDISEVAGSHIAALIE